MPVASKESLAAKLLEVQQEVAPQIHFDAHNPHFRNGYVTLSKCLEVIRPLLWARGILLTQFLAATSEGEPAIETMFQDTTNGEVLRNSVPLVLEKTSPQAAGSAITYFRRYGLLSALALVGDEDDDAESASSTASQSTQKPQGSAGTTPRF